MVMLFGIVRADCFVISQLKDISIPNGCYIE